VEKKWTDTQIDALPQIAEQILNTIAPNKRIAFYGQMGAGKTTLIKMICAQLGVLENTSSPTFSIVNEYAGNAIIYHFDLFRLNKPTELADIGFSEYLESNHYIFIEWPEIIENVIDELDFAKVIIETESNIARTIKLIY
jgi:tRNA threonylcarbamoyladenosine biosynthesis protein TsaE